MMSNELIAAAAPVVEKFRAAKVEPEGYVLYAYAAMQLFEQAATAAKSTKYADLEKAMRGGTFKTVIGDLSFDAKGDQNGDLQQIGGKDQPTIGPDGAQGAARQRRFQQVRRIARASRAGCFAAFLHNQYVGMLVFAGIALSYLLQG